MKVYAIVSSAIAKVANSSTQVNVITSDAPPVIVPPQTEISYLATFNNNSLINGELIVPFDSSDGDMPQVDLFNQNGIEVYPTDVIIRNPSTIAVVLEGYTPILGSWTIRVN